ncbi:MAG: hypothetical protein ACRERE_40190 [Candidatus Entotheonellia bacterium]
MNTAPTPQGRWPGSLAWAGLASTFVWIEPTPRVTGVFVTPLRPFCDPQAITRVRAYEAAVYQAREAWRLGSAARLPGEKSGPDSPHPVSWGCVRAEPGAAADGRQRPLRSRVRRRLSAAVNNAGIEGSIVPMIDYIEDYWDAIIDINLKGV